MNMYVWGAASAVCLLVTLILAVFFRKTLQKYCRLSALQMITVGMAVVMFILFLPAELLDAGYNGTDLIPVLRAACLAVFESVKVFAMGADLGLIENALPADATTGAAVLRLYVLCAYFFAPVLTFGNILSAFTGVMVYLRLRFCGTRPLSVFSELNEASIALAESIDEKKHGHRPVMVFAGTGREAAPDDLRYRAERIGAYFVNKDPSLLKIGRRSRAVEFFLMSAEHEYNVEQALRLSELYQAGRHKVSVFVYESSEYTDLLLDSSADSDRVLSREFREIIRNSPEKIFFDNVLEDRGIDMYGDFSLRCIDNAHSMAMDVLTAGDYADYESIFAAAEVDKTISVLILGMDRVGAEFLKTAAWFYQRYGYRVEFNVFCGKNDEWNEARLRQCCPELFRVSDPTSGESCHDIRCFSAVDTASSDLDGLFLSEDRERLGKTKLAFVDLGDDGQNVETAMFLRSLFDRIHGEKKANADRQPIPYIYCVVRSDKRTETLTANGGLRNHKRQNFHIDFVGAFTDQYSYARIDRIRQREAEGFYYHLDWVRKESHLRNHYERCVREKTDLHFLQEIDAEMQGGTFAWNDAGYFEDEARTVFKAAALLDEAAKYMNHTYYRQSSIAKLEHKAAVSRFYPDTQGHSPVCSCGICREKRITEHMRWNAYMRGRGYRYAETGYDRAKLHADLKEWDRLPCRERYKD